jgi:hypothetical protein
MRNGPRWPLRCTQVTRLARASLFAGLLLAVAGQVVPARVVVAQVASEPDHVAVIELGGAGEWPVAAGRASAGGNVAAEVTPIEHWLEVEGGVSVLGSAGQSEADADLVFKKPFQLSPHVEFMPGIGPDVTWVLHGSGPARALATEAVADFMVWPTKNVGWYAEPSWAMTSLRWSRASIGLTAGLMVGVPWAR